MTYQLDVTKAFRGSQGDIPGTVFRGGQRKPYKSSRNTAGMTALSFSIAKGMACIKQNVSAFGISDVNGEKRFLAELSDSSGLVSVIEYNESNKTFYHNCRSTMGFCYHLFEMIGLMRLQVEPNGEFAQNFNAIDFSRTVNDEQHFFVAADALYFDSKDHYHGNEVEAYEDNPDRKVVEDLTFLIGKDGNFTVPTSFGPSSSAAPTSSPSSASPSFQPLDWNRDFTDAEEANIQKNLEKLQGKPMQSKYDWMAKMIGNGDAQNLMFLGGAGTGKTTLARQLALLLNAPVYIQNYSLNAEESTIVGRFVPDPAVPGKFNWIDGEFLKAFRNGGFYLADEINFAKPAVMGVFNNVLDGVGQIVLDNGEVIERHPNFRFFGAMNPGYNGTQRLNKAFINRFDQVVMFQDMDPAEMKKVIVEDSGYSNAKVIDKMIEAYQAIKAKIKNDEIDEAIISIRNLVAWGKTIKNTLNIVEAARSTVVVACCYEDEDVQKEILEDIILAKFQGVKA
ncbi:AAA family ATPase [Cytobacillus sp. FJAT-54145]|uniref:AAA family ATPase n=1 Tax=Cytobacillus spartinae TaxID=3299023 RepID=A0ABW6KAN1_9BACI